VIAAASFVLTPSGRVLDSGREYVLLE